MQSQPPKQHPFWKSRRALRLALAGVLVVAVATTIAAAKRGDNDDRDDDRRGYAIGLWGDLPYSDAQALTGVPNLIADMNAQDLAFVAHDGDLKAGNGTPGSVTPTTCADALYTQALGYFNPSVRPLFSPPVTMIGPTATALQTAASALSSALITSAKSSSARHSLSASIASSRKYRPILSASASVA